jgi:hypothetical protein
VRGFLAAVVRKKLGLRLESEKTDGERVYRRSTGQTQPLSRPRSLATGRLAWMAFDGTGERYSDERRLRP